MKAKFLAAMGSFLGGPYPTLKGEALFLSSTAVSFR